MSNIKFKLIKIKFEVIVKINQSFKSFQIMIYME
jgi:hypothetical protein